VPWPSRLVPFLDGHADLRVVEHLSGDEVHAGRLQVGSGTEPIAVRDAAGRPVAVDKFGNLERMFDGLDRSGARVLAEMVAALVRDIDAFGVCGFVAYGSLLGAVRAGRIIGHDTDADVAYLSDHTHPGDIALESLALGDFLLARGWEIERPRVGKAQAVFVDPDGDKRHIDIFVATLQDGHLFIDQMVEADGIDRSAFQPQSTVVLEGVEILAPADPATVLAATYGPTWEVPDPSFSFDQPPSLQRTSRALMGNNRMRRTAWIHHLQAEVARRKEVGPTPFVRWADEHEHRHGDEPRTWLDLGCGASTDAIWVARHGHRSIGLDFATPRLRASARTARNADLPARFWDVSFHDVRAVLAAVAAIGATSAPRVVTCRRVLEHLDGEGRNNLWLLAKGALLDGGRMYVEWHTGRVEGQPGPRFLPLPAAVVEQEARCHGARVLSRTDDGALTRLVLTFS
jgi:hypothetical protein